MPEDPVPPTSPATVVDDADLLNSVEPSANPDARPTGDRSKTGTSGSFVWSCTEWEETGQDRIVQIINPSQVRWTIPFRRSKTNAFGGTIIYDWMAPDGSTLDLPTLSITMQTGSLYPLSYFSSSMGEHGPIEMRPVTAVEKIRVFYRFCELTASPSFTTSGKPNLITLDYHTILFPDVKMQVKFMEPLTFSEDARNPFNIEYTIGLIVLKMVPSLSALTELESKIGVSVLG